jgi:hypothetical protein
MLKHLTLHYLTPLCLPRSNSPHPLSIYENSIYFLSLETKKVIPMLPGKIQGQFDAAHSFNSKFPMPNWPE